MTLVLLHYFRNLCCVTTPFKDGVSSHLTVIVVLLLLVCVCMCYGPTTVEATKRECPYY